MTSPYPHLDRNRFARATQKIMQACSDQEGVNCYTYALIAQTALQRLEIPAVLRVGYAAWRVGPGRDDVVLHHPAGALVDTLGPDQRGFIYHAWIQIGKELLDFTTYQLRGKAEAMTAIDGIPLAVDWCPQFLWVSVQSSYKVDKVINGMKAGMYCYEPNRIIHDKLKRHEAYDIDEYHVDALLQAYAVLSHGDVQVYGPANLGVNKHG